MKCQRRWKMGIRSKIEKLKESVRKADYLKTAALSGAMLFGGNASAQTENISENNKAEITQEQNILQEDGKNFSLMGDPIHPQTQGFTEFCKKNQLPNNGADYEAILPFDNGLVIGVQLDENSELKFIILDKDEQGKRYDVSDKYLMPEFGYDFGNGSFLVAYKYDDNGDMLLEPDHYILFHKDKTVARISAETLASSSFKVTPKCLLVSREQQAGSFDEMKNLVYFMPKMIQEEMIYEDGKKVKLPPAFRVSEVDENGNLVTYPASKQEIIDLSKNGLFNDEAEQIIQDNLDKFKYQVGVDGLYTVQHFFDTLNTPLEQSQSQRLEENFGIEVNAFYNMDNLRTFYEEHKKIVNPLKTLVLTPEHFKNQGR